MAYGDSTLGAEHRWSFDGDYLDSIGSLSGTSTGADLPALPITRDNTNSMRTNGRDDLVSAPVATTSANSNFERFAFQGWFSVSQIQGPPCMIYKQGGSNGYAIFLWAGNNVMLQTKNNAGNTLIQIYSNFSLTSNRPYHFFVRFLGSSFGNEVEFWIDGVKQTRNLDGVNPNTTSMAAHTGNHIWGENGTTGTEVAIGNETVIIKAPIDGLFSEWWIWNDADAGNITESQINNDLFGAGAIPELTISSGTQSAMQASLDAISGTTRGDEPLNILIEAVTGDGDLELTATDIVFPDRASIHVRYEGNGQLTWINGGTSNASRGSTTNLDVIFVQTVTLTVTVLDATDFSPVNGARVLLEAASGGTQTVGTDLISGNTGIDGKISTTFNFDSNQPVIGKIRKGTSTIYYKPSLISDIITSNGLNITVLMVKDE